MLIFTLKKQWYEKIKSGEKLIEYREVKMYWIKRIINSTQQHNYLYDYKACDFKSNIPTNDIYFKIPMPCFLQLGYNPESRLKADIIKIEIVDGRNTDLHIDKPVYAIHLTDVKEIE